MSLGLPYMGSKRKIAGNIISAILQRHPEMKNFYDLFGGGGAISFEMLKRKNITTHYNELNRHIYSLIKYLKENKTLEPKFYEWVTREEFFNQINKTNDEADWYSGFVMCCWSFGNKQTGYLYGKDIEDIKRLAHEFIVNKDLNAMREIGVDIPELTNIDGVQNRRIVFCDYIKKEKKERFDVENLERVEHLERMQNLQNLQNLQITNLSYENVDIKSNNSVIYCDIPYKGTGEYKEGGFNHDAFYEWFSNLEYPAYLSEYDAPFQQVEGFSHRSTLSATNNSKKTVEKLFWNGKGNAFNYKLF